MRLQNKVIVITGAGSGFGEGMARRFVAEGAKVLIADLDRASGQRLADELGAMAHFCAVDVAENSQVKNMIGTALSKFGRIDVLVNNAGFTHCNMPMLDVDETTFDRIYAVNVKSIYLAARHVVPIFRDAGGGVILNIASTAGVRPRPGLAWYNSSKAAVIGMTKSMAIELAPDKIRVCAVNPVAGETGMLHLFMGEDTEEMRDAFRSTIPLGRLSLPSDIANAALYLVSDEAEMLTGVCLEVDGGRCI